MSDFYGYNPADYIKDFSWVGEAGRAISNAAREMPQIIQMNKLIKENTKYKEQAYTEFNKMIDTMDDQDKQDLAISIGLDSNIIGDKNALTQALKNRIPKPKYGVSGEEEKNEEYTKRIMGSIGKDLVTAMEKGKWDLGKTVASMSNLQNVGARSGLTDTTTPESQRLDARRDFRAELGAREEFAQKGREAEQGIRAEDRKAITAEQTAQGDIVGAALGTNVKNIPSSDQIAIANLFQRDDLARLAATTKKYGTARTTDELKQWTKDLNDTRAELDSISDAVMQFNMMLNQGVDGKGEKLTKGSRETITEKLKEIKGNWKQMKLQEKEQLAQYPNSPQASAAAAAAAGEAMAPAPEEKKSLGDNLKANIARLTEQDRGEPSPISEQSVENWNPSATPLEKTNLVRLNLIKYNKDKWKTQGSGINDFLKRVGTADPKTGEIITIDDVVETLIKNGFKLAKDKKQAPVRTVSDIPSLGGF